MIQLVVGWAKNLFHFSNEKQFEPVVELTPSRMGYYFEHDELKRLMKRLENFETVEFTDVSGTPLTPERIDKRFGKDGGIDCVIHIVTPTERGANNVAGRIRNILISGDY
jgi:tetrahydromethanopterin S-methyltransferase subunit G